MDHYAPLPTDVHLAALSTELGGTVRFDHRIVGGLGGTMDVLRFAETGRRVVLKRYWVPESDDDEPAESEYRILTLAAEHGVPAPDPLWIDRIGLFPERAVVMSFLDGEVVLDPVDPLDWAAQLANALHSIHKIRIGPADDTLFPTIERDDDHVSEELVRQHPLGPDLWAALEESYGRVRHEAPVYVHHDFWPGNTLWIDQMLVAVVDWEGGRIADPGLDVGYCALDIRFLGLDEAADHFVNVYREVSGRALGQPPLLGANRAVPPDARHRAVGAGLAGAGVQDHPGGGPGTACTPDRDRSEAG